MSLFKDIDCIMCRMDCGMT